MLLLLAAALLAPAAAVNTTWPKWTAPWPVITPTAGYPQVPLPQTDGLVYYASPAYGTYNHGPIITFWNNTFYVTWYNGVADESVNNRVLIASSTDGLNYTRPLELFPPVVHNLTGTGDENEAFAEIDNRLYAMASSWDVFQRDGHGAEHLGPTRPFLRRVYDPSSFGTIFWLGDVPLGYESYGFLPLSAMDATTQADMQTLAGALINTTTLSDNGEPNERSLYAVPKPNADGSRTLVQLMRAGNSSLPLMLASTCNVPGSWVPPPPSGNTYKYACRPGTGITQLNTLQDPIAPAAEPLAAAGPTLDFRVCNWTEPTNCGVPDSGSRSCSAPLKNGTIFLVGAQLMDGRDPLVLSLSDDGVTFDRAFWVRDHCPPMRYPGSAKEPGYQYPGALVLNETLYIVYSINKEDIGITKLQL